MPASEQSTAIAWSDADAIVKHLVEQHITPITEMSAGIFSGGREDYTYFWSKIYALWLEIRSLALRKESQKERAKRIDTTIEALPEKINAFISSPLGDRQRLKKELILEFMSLMRSVWSAIVGCQIFWQLRPDIPEMTKEDVAKAIPMGLRPEMKQEEDV